MGECGRRTPGHGEAHVEGDAELLGNVQRGVGGWIRDDGVGSKGRVVVGWVLSRDWRCYAVAGHGACCPGTFEHFLNLGAALADVAGFSAGFGGEDAWVFHLLGCQYGDFCGIGCWEDTI